MRVESIVVLVFIVVSNAILITEIMYHPRDYDEYFEYIEFYNEGTTNIIMDGWAITELDWTFPNNTVLGPGQYLVVSCNKYRLIQAYPYLNTPGIIVLGDYDQSENGLNADGQKIKLINTIGIVQALVSYKSESPWPYLPRGFGSSLELLCYDINKQDQASSWGASPVPEDPDSHVEYGGSPGKPGFWKTCAPNLPVSSNILFSEIMYHPITSIAIEDMFEFIELYNNDTVDVDLTDWRIVSSGTLRFRFSQGTIIKAGTYLTVAKNLTEFAVAYPSAQGIVVGPYKGELSNGDDDVVLIDVNGLMVDKLSYEDGSGDSNWPLAADAFGASYNDLPTDSPFYINYDSYKYRGQSLSRRSFYWDTDTTHNWAAKDPSPNVENLDNAAILLPTITKRTINKGDIDIIFPNATVSITIGLKPWPIDGLNITSIVINYWTYNPITKVNSNYGSFSLTPDDDEWKGHFDIQPANTIRRYTITVSFSNGEILNAPDIKDPYRYYSYFVTPDTYPGIKTYHLFLNPTDWNLLFTSVNTGANNNRVTGTNLCYIRDAWDTKVWSVLVSDGNVIDTQVRLQGSRWNRPNGVGIDSSLWNHDRPSILRAWSYRFSLPDYAQISGADVLLLSKMFQGCTMYDTPLMNELSMDLGIAASKYKMIRLNAQGYFLRYMMELGHGSTNYIKDYLDTQNANCVHQSKEVVGHLFKDQGCNIDEGPWGYGDWRQFPTSCTGVVNPNGGTNPPWDPLTRYEYTYGRQTHSSWGTHIAMKQMIDDFSLIQGQNSAQYRQIIDSYLDMNLFLNYLVLINWACTWDQMFQNQFTYQRATDGQWSWHPWDSDSMFGEAYGWSISCDLTAGDATEYHYLKQQVIKNFLPEIQQRYRLLQATILNPSYSTPILDKIYSKFDKNQASSSPGGYSQNFDDCYNNIRSFLTDRYNWVNSNLGVWDSATYGDPWEQIKIVTCPEKPDVVRIYTLDNYKAKPGKPLAPLIVNVTYNAVVLQFYPPNVNGYPLLKYNLRFAGTPNGPWEPSTSISPTTTIFSVEGMSSSTNYYFQINAVTDGGVSEWSDVTDVDTLKAPPPPTVPTPPIAPIPDTIPTPPNVLFPTYVPTSTPVSTTPSDKTPTTFDIPIVIETPSTIFKEGENDSSDSGETFPTWAIVVICIVILLLIVGIIGVVFYKSRNGKTEIV